MKKVLITPRSFARHNKQELIDLLQAHGIEPVFNTSGSLLNEAQMIEHLQGMDGLIVGVDPLNERVLRHAPQLKTIAKYGVGIDNIDSTFAKEHGISITRTIDANSNAVADYAMTLMLMVARRAVEIDYGCHHDDWSKKEALDIYGKKIGVLGLGAIGKGVVKRAKGFAMNVYAYDIYRDEAFIKEHDITFTDIETIIKECDFLTLHLPLSDSTRHLLNKRSLAKAKETLIIVNTARGGLLQEDDLYELLKARKIYGLGIDVFEEEPPRNSKLLTLRYVVAGSHTAASTVEAINTMSRMAVEHLIDELDKHP